MVSPLLPVCIDTEPYNHRMHTKLQLKNKFPPFPTSYTSRQHPFSVQPLPAMASHYHIQTQTASHMLTWDVTRL